MTILATNDLRLGFSIRPEEILGDFRDLLRFRESSDFFFINLPPETHIFACFLRTYKNQQLLQLLLQISHDFAFNLAYCYC